MFRPAQASLNLSDLGSVRIVNMVAWILPSLPGAVETFLG